MKFWIGHATHTLTRGMLRLFGPAKTLRALRALSSMSCDARTARHLAATLEPSGTCLTRALAVAAVTPGSVVVLGGWLDANRFNAHAWVEIDGIPLRAWDRSGKPLATVRASRHER